MGGTRNRNSRYLSKRGRFGVIRACIGSWILLSVAPQILAAAEPQWLTDARAREGKLADVREVISSDRAFSARLPVAVMGKIEKEQGSYTIEFSVGSEAPASCEIYADSRDPAALLRTLAQKTFSDAVGKTQGKVERTVVELIDAGEFGATPYLSVRWLYRVNDGTDARLGALKQYAADKLGHGIYCAHLDLGYVHTFEGVVKALVESIEFRDQPLAQKPFYSELEVASLKGLRVGYSMLTLERDADGDVKALERSALLLPVTPETLSSLDSLNLEWTHADGKMINAARVVSVNDVLDADLSLKPSKGSWHVEGEFKSKKIDETIESAIPPGSWLSQALQRRALLAADAAAPQEAEFAVWLSADPVHFTESRMALLERMPKTGEARFRDSVGGIVADVTADAATGQVVKAVVPLGGQTISMERLDAQGAY